MPERFCTWQQHRHKTRLRSKFQLKCSREISAGRVLWHSAFASSSPVNFCFETFMDGIKKSKQIIMHCYRVFSFINIKMTFSPNTDLSVLGLILLTCAIVVGLQLWGGLRF